MPRLTDVAWLGPYPDARGLQQRRVRGARLRRRPAGPARKPGHQRLPAVQGALAYSAWPIATVDQRRRRLGELHAAADRRRSGAGARRISTRTTTERARRRVLHKVVTVCSSGPRSTVTSTSCCSRCLTEDVAFGRCRRCRTRAAGRDHRRRVFATTIAFTCGSWRHVPTHANGQPALAYYVDGTPFALNVLTIGEGRITEVVAFVVRTVNPDNILAWPDQPPDPARVERTFERFGLPARL